MNHEQSSYQPNNLGVHSLIDVADDSAQVEQVLRAMERSGDACAMRVAYGVRQDLLNDKDYLLKLRRYMESL